MVESPSVVLALASVAVDTGGNLETAVTVADITPQSVFLGSSPEAIIDRP